MHASPVKITSWAHQNPFRSKCIEQLNYKFCTGNYKLLFDKLENSNYRGAIVGPHGSGKTTLLEQIYLVLGQQGRSCRLLTGYRESNRKVSWNSFGPSCSEILLIDGYDLLTLSSQIALNIKTITLRTKGLIVTAHRVPKLIPTLHRCRTTPELLNELLKQLVPEQSWSKQCCSKLLSAHNGNLRMVFSELYDTYQKQDF